MRRAAPALPNGFTLGNLFFGIFAIVSASRNSFDHAVLFIVLGGVCDAFDGAVARATRTGSRFGEELDSLVDAISFGLAPAMIVYFSTLPREGWAWFPVFIFAACAVLRLARFNVTQAGEAKTYFMGLPSPAAGGTLATYYWFTQTPLYNSTRIIDLPWQEIMRYLMILLAFLMISSVPYPAWPKVGVRSWRALGGLLLVLLIVLGATLYSKYFFFLFGVAYVLYGLLRALVLALLDLQPAGIPRRRAGDYVDPMEAYGGRRHEVDRDRVHVSHPEFDPDEDGAPDAERRVRQPGAASAADAERDERARRRRRRRRKGGGGGHGGAPPAAPPEHGSGTPPE
jgi:CDP-diacylglycerol--serine O-phosphatidyltransferase